MAKKKIKFPYKAWILMPSFKPVEVEFVRDYVVYGGADFYHVTTGNKIVAAQNIFASKSDAIDAGNSLLEDQQAVICKRQAAIDKRQAALAKAAKE